MCVGGAIGARRGRGRDRARNSVSPAGDARAERLTSVLGRRSDEMDAHLKKPRRCTDILFLVVYIAFWTMMFALGFYGVGKGDPTALVFGADFNGKLCGEGNNTGFKTRYLVNPLEVMYAAGALDGTTRMGKYNLRDAKSYCVKECPTPKNTTGQVQWFCSPDHASAGTRENWAANDYNYYSSLSSSEMTTSQQMKGPCYPVLVNTVNTFYTCQFFGSGDDHALTELRSGSYAFTTNDTPTAGSWPVALTSMNTAVQTLSDQVEKLLSGPLATIERYVDDFTTGWKVLVVAGAVCPIVLSVLFLFFIRYFTGIFAYTIIVCVNVLSIVLTIYLFLKAGLIGSDEVNAYVSKVSEGAATAVTNYADPAENNQQVLKVFAYIALALTIIFFVFTLIMLRRVKVAVGVIKVATSALGKMPTLTLFPITPALFMVLLFVYWLFTLVFLYSSGDLKMQDCYLDSSVPPQKFCASTSDAANCHCGYGVSWNRNLQGALVYYVFGFLWGSQWLLAMSYLVIACCFTQYYFKGGAYNSASRWPIVAATKRMTWYHSGSAALGSFFVALLQFIRIVTRFVVHRLKKLNKDSKIIKYVGYYVECCLWYLQKCIEWFNRNAYIMTAIEGTSFCTSAWNALALIVKNITTIATVSILGDIMLFLGKLTVSLGSGVIAFLMLDADTFNYGDEKVSSPLFIVIVVVLFAFLIASVFMSLVELGIDTIVLCYCKDCDDNGGTPLNAPPALVKALGASKKIAKMRQEEAADRAARAGQ